MNVLGIETSCDETAAAVVGANNGELALLSNVVASSVDLHAVYGGVVPEIAARSHLEHINPVVEKALDDAKKSWHDVDAIGVTQGPGLGGSLMVGVLCARTLAILKKKPLYPVNHVMAHVDAAFFENKPAFPLLALIVSGGHSHLILFKDHFDYQVLGQTLDDAVGEAFDKVAKIIGLSYPGGPSIEKAAAGGDPKAYKFPRAKLASSYDFSFSGLKTAVLRAAQQTIGEDFRFPSHQVASRLTNKQQRDIAASFQTAALGALVNSLEEAVREFSLASIIVAGGVAANQALRALASDELEQPVNYPPIELCTDNGAMIAAQTIFQIQTGQKPADPFGLEFLPSLKI